MYDIDEAQEATDALWLALRRAFEREGIADVPERLTRELPVISHWGAPHLFFSQCCGYDIVFGFSSALELLGAFAAAPGGWKARELRLRVDPEGVHGASNRPGGPGEGPRV